MAKKTRRVATPKDLSYARNASVILPSARTAQAGLFTMPAGVTWPTREMIKAAATQLELDTLAAVARVAYDEAQSVAEATAGDPGGHPTREQEIFDVLDAMDPAELDNLLRQSKTALFRHLYNTIVAATGRTEWLGDDALARACKKWQERK